MLNLLLFDVKKLITDLLKVTKDLIQFLLRKSFLSLKLVKIYKIHLAKVYLFAILDIHHRESAVENRQNSKKHRDGFLGINNTNRFEYRSKCARSIGFISVEAKKSTETAMGNAEDERWDLIRWGAPCAKLHVRMDVGRHCWPSEKSSWAHVRPKISIRSGRAREPMMFLPGSCNLCPSIVRNR